MYRHEEIEQVLTKARYERTMYLAELIACGIVWVVDLFHNTKQKVKVNVFTFQS